MTNRVDAGMRMMTRALAARITRLEADIVNHSRNGDRQLALYAAHTATYLRDFLATTVGPTWLVVAAEDVSDAPVSSD